MRKIVYIGGKPVKADNVAGTGLTWARGEVHDVVDDNAADKLLEHKGVWADANSDYKLAEPEVKAKPEPRVMIVPSNANDPSWDPITIVVSDEVFKSLQAKETVAVFMTPEDADTYAEFKEEFKADKKPDGQPESDGGIQPWDMDKRSKAYKAWAAANPELAAAHADNQKAA